MNVVIIDYKSGNLRSAAKAFEKVAAGGVVKVSDNPDDLKNATHIVLPGVGGFADCMAGIRAVPGLVEEMETQVLQNKKPFLGICVGMQLLAEKDYEHGVHKGFGWIKGKVKKIRRITPEMKVPHMGWNNLKIRQNHPLVAGIKSGEHTYFVHSYKFICADENDLVAEVYYGRKITSIIARGNIFGAQFHPEKSQETGLKFIRNFLQIK